MPKSKTNKSLTLLQSVQNMLKDMNKTLKQNEMMRWGLRVLVILYITMIVPQMSGEQLQLFDNMLFRLVMVVLIVALCQVDCVLALLVAISYVVSIQKLNRSQMLMSTTQQVRAEGFANQHEHQEEEKMGAGGSCDKEDIGGGNAHQVHQQHQQHHEQEDQMGAGGSCDKEDIGGGDSCEKEYFTNQHQSFTSRDQLADCQHNLVGGEENQTNQVQTWRNEMGPQGLSLPLGGSEAVSLPAEF